MIARCLRPQLALALLLAACAGTPHGAADPAAVTAADLPPVPFCRDEMRAYVELIRLVNLRTGDWAVFEPAVDALKQQIIDCIDDNRANFSTL